MKLQNMTVIFIIIMIPIILVVSYYIGLQINTITMQKNYTVKLQTAAKDSIQALEINTVEWNSASSNLADSKRRDVLASINTFTTSLANNMGIGGAGKGRIQAYIPAIVYTMYDGYYIYSASLMKDQDTDKDGLTQFNADGTIKSNGKSYQYILKPYSPYSARYASANGSIDVTVNYTLDNYIRVYGTVNGEYQAKEGYLVVCDDDAGVRVNKNGGSISGITYRGATIKPEALTEQVYTDEGVKEYQYIYDQYDNKLYWDNKDGTNEGNYFSVDKNNNKVYLQTALPEGDAGFSITNRFRKISIPMYDNREDEWTVQKVFQILNPRGGYKFYYENQSGAFVEFTNPGKTLGTVKQEEDYSAINYCVESYVFTQWVTKNLGNIKVGDMQISTGNSINSLENITSAEQQYYGQYNNVGSDQYIFRISDSNNPDPENDDAYAESVLAQHKKDIIINTIEKNLSQATAQAQGMNPNYEYRLPQLSYDEWEQALSNISIIAFMQGMPIGLKYYNNYAIATSTLNKEFVDPDELYFAGKDDQYYHQRQCEQATGSDYVGYRSIDYVAKSYEKSDNGTTSTKYYYPHANSTNSELECYYCLVNRSTYKNNGRWKGNLLYKNWSDSYYNALARERYMQLDEPGTYKPNVTVKKTAKPTSVEYGDEIEYTIEITNNGIVDDTITFLDYWNTDELNREESDIKVSSTKNRGSNKIEIVDWNDNNNNLSGISSVDNVGIYIYAGETITITYKAIPKGTLGKDIKNTAAIYSFTNKDTKLAEATAITSVEKKVTANVNTVIEQKNIYLVLDTSNSMDRWIYSNPDAILESQKGVGEGTYPEAVRKFIKDVRQKGSSVKGGVLFSQVAVKKETGDIEEKKDIWRTWGGTLYVEALNMAKNEVEEGDIMVFFTDGNPTYGFVGSGIEIKYSATSKLWKSIKNEADEIKRKGVTIYTAGFGNESNLDGLKKVVASPEKAFYGNNIDTLFEDIFNGVFEDKLEGIEKEYKSIKGKIQLQYVNRIEEINIGGNKLQNFKDYIEITDETDSKNIKGTLDLTKLNNADLSKPISIIYK